MFLRIKNFINLYNFNLNITFKTTNILRLDIFMYVRLFAFTTLVFFIEAELISIVLFRNSIDWLYLQAVKFLPLFFQLFCSEWVASPIKVTAVTLVFLVFFSGFIVLSMIHIQKKTFYDLLFYVFVFIICLMLIHSLFALALASGGFATLPSRLRWLARYIYSVCTYPFKKFWWWFIGGYDQESFIQENLALIDSERKKLFRYWEMMKRRQWRYWYNSGWNIFSSEPSDKEKLLWKETDDKFTEVLNDLNSKEKILWHAIPKWRRKEKDFKFELSEHFAAAAEAAAEELRNKRKKKKSNWRQDETTVNSR